MTVSDIANYVGLGFWGIIAILVLIGALKGRSRGILRQMVRTLTIVASIVIGFLVSGAAYNSVTQEITEKKVSGYIASFGIQLDEEAIEMLDMLSPETTNLILAIPFALLIIPLLFVLVFIVSSGVLHIVHAIICKIAGFSKHNNTKLTRALGALLGAVQGLAVAVVVLVLPVGFSASVSDAVAALPSQPPAVEEQAPTGDGEEINIKELYAEYIQPISEHSSVKFLGAVGGNALYDSLATVSVNQKDHQMSKEIVAPTLKLITSIDSITEIDFENMNEDDKAAFSALIDIVDGSPYMTSLIASALDDIATALSDGALSEDTDEMVKSLLSVFVDMKDENVVPTLELIRDALFLVNGFTDAESLESNKTEILALIDSIEENDYKKTLLANILDSVATAINEESEGSEEGEMVEAVLSIFIDIDPDDVAPTLELIVDTAFLLGEETEFDEETINKLIAAIETNEKKADVLATMLNSIAAALKEENSDDDAMNSVFELFENMDGKSVVPKLELIRDSMFFIDEEFVWENLGKSDSTERIKFDALMDSIEKDEIKQDSLAVILDALAEGEEDETMSAIFQIFDDIPGEDVAPTLEILVDSIFMTELDWDTLKNENSPDRKKFENLIDTAENDPLKAKALATILDAVADDVTDDTDDVTKSVISIFDDITGPEVAPTLEVLLDAMFMTEIDWNNLKNKDGEPTEDRRKLNDLIDSVEDNEVKQDVLAVILDAVADDQKSDDNNDMMASIIGIFDGIEGEAVAPTLEVMLDAIFMTDVDWESLTEEDRDNLDNLIETSKGNKPKEKALAVLLDAVSDTFAVENSGSGEDISGEFVESVFGVFKDIDEVPEAEQAKNGVIPTLEVVRDVLFMLDDETVGEGDEAKTVLQVLSSDDSGNGQLSEVFSRKDENGDTLIRRVNSRLDDTDNTAALVTSMTKISLSVMSDSKADSTGSTTITTETYDNVNAGVKDIVSVNQKYQDVLLEKDTPEYEEYVGEVSDTLGETFTENGIEVEDEVVNDMAEYVADNYKDKVEELSDAEVNDIILSYYEAYLKQQEQNGGAN